MSEADTTQRDSGAVLVLVSVAMTVLLGMAALVVDVGALALERREVQNGADAAALAVAQDCALGNCSSARTTAADALARNGDNGRATSLVTVCGTDPRRSLTSCGGTTPPRSTGASGWVRVSGRTSVDYVLAPIMGPVAGDADASATAAWGPLGSSQVTAWTISLCEYTKLGGNPSRGTFPSGRTYIYFHEAGNAAGQDEGDESDEEGGCPSDGEEHDEGHPPGGFGWLNPVSGCTTDQNRPVTVGSWVAAKPGVSVPNICTNTLSTLQGMEVLVPLFDADLPARRCPSPIARTSGCYHVVGFVGFRVLGYRFSSNSRDIWPGGFRCPIRNANCIHGEFTRIVRGSGDFGGANYGASVVKFLQ